MIKHFLSLAFLVVLAACTLGMGAKEVMVTAPVLVLLYDRTFAAGSFGAAWRTRRWFYAGLACTWLPLLWLVAGGGGTRGSGAGLGLGVTGWSYALKQGEAITHYLRLSLWPQPLVLDYGVGVVDQLREVLPQALGVVLLVAGTVWALWRRPAAGFLGAWFFIILAPSSSFVPIIGQTMAEHRLYLPLAAVLTALVLSLWRLGRRVGLAAGLVLALLWAVMTVQRNREYHDAITLWRATARHAPGNYRAHYNLGVELARTPSGKAEAIAEFIESIRLQPNYAEAHNNLAIELAQLPGREDDAVRHYETALRLRPDFADAHYNLAAVLGRRPGGGADAIAHYEAALRLRPDQPETHNNLAVELGKLPGRLPDAVAHYETALRLDPDYAEAHYGLANALALTPGRRTDAVPHYEAALRLRPDYAEAHYGLAVALMQQPGRSPEAKAHYEAVLLLQPENFAAHYNLANQLAATPSHLAEAITHYEAAVRLQPDFPEARNNLAGAYYRAGRIDEAIRQLDELLRRDPGNRQIRRNLELLQQSRRRP